MAFKSFMTDTPRATHRRRLSDAELAQRTAIAHFPDPNIKASRKDEDETLRIYREVMKGGLRTEEPVGHFIGNAFSAEPGEAGLTIYHYAGGGGGIPTGAIGDRHIGPMSAARLQQMIIERRAGDAEDSARFALERLGGR